MVHVYIGYEDLILPFQWNDVNIEVTESVTSFKLRFVSTQGLVSTPMAIDDVLIHEGKCTQYAGW